MAMARSGGLIRISCGRGVSQLKAIAPATLSNPHNNLSRPQPNSQSTLRTQYSGYR